MIVNNSINIVIASLCFCLLLTTSCTKKASGRRCDAVSGIYEPNHYLFWINHDPGSVIYVIVKDESGNDVSTIYHETSVYYTTGQPASCFEDNCARFDLKYGADYTYSAKTNTVLSWSGEIQTPCDEAQCQLIQLK